MCGPPAIALAAAAVTMAGQLTQGVGAARQAGYESQLARQNAQIRADQAKDAITRGDEQLKIQQNKASQERGQMVASMASNGIDVSFGSASDVLADQKEFAAEDAKAIVDNYQRERQGYLVDAMNYTAQARAAKAQKRSAIVGTALSMAGTALSSAAQVGKINAAQSAGKSGWSAF
jgi:hypothetical protein